jgi:hypothetical protein
MQVFEESEAVNLAAVLDPVEMDGHPAMEMEQEMAPVSEGFLLEVLGAVANMALRSKRRQADLDAAMRYAGLEAGPVRRLAALEQLALQGCIDKVVELNDGGVLLSVTAFGLDRLGGARRG